MTSCVFCISLLLMKSSKNQQIGMIKIFDDLDRLFTGFAENTYSTSRAAWSPLYDLFVTKEKLVIVVELPGVEKEEISVSISTRGLIIRGKREAPKLVREGQIFYNLEIPFGRFERRIPFPIDVRIKEVDINLANGLLTLIFPLKGEYLERIIPIEEG